jgi:exopolysaccharide biosynthesis polyprenyl glycosylphosphotransferase
VLKERAREVAAIVALCDILLLCLSFFAAFAVRFYLLARWDPSLPIISLANLLWLPFLSIFVFSILLRWGGVYGSLRNKNLLDTALMLAKPILLGGLILGSVIFFLQAKYFSRSLFGLFLGIYYVLLLAEKVTLRIIQRATRRKGFNYRNVLVVGINEGAMRVADTLTEGKDYGFRVAGFINGPGQDYVQADTYKVLGSIHDIPELVDREIIDEVIFALPIEQLAMCESHLLKCEEVGIKIHIRADIAHSIFSRTYLGTVAGIPILTLASTPHAAGDILLKRLMDIVLSFTSLVLAAPFMGAIAIMIKLDSPGPVLFRQVRLGLNGRRFQLLKFRSMIHHAEGQRAALEELNEMSGPVFKIANDPRITRIGAFLRRTSLDELPQLLNVLRGDMSLVGPRPPLPSEVARYERWQRRRLSMKPGITCLWQANGRNRLDFDEWMRMDMEYIDKWSLGTDVKIILKTIPAVLFARGAR